MKIVSASQPASRESSGVSRRQFLRATATTAAAFSLVPRHVLGGAKFVPPSEKVNIAIVGCGGQGRTNCRALFNEADAQIIAVADPIEHFSLEGFYYKGLGGRKPVTAEIAKHHSQKTPNYRVAEYEDFRVMLEKEKAIDAILCATPDHNHAYVSVTAMRLGKHVYCEKPLTHNIWEARFVAKVAKETGVATQMGNHGHSGEGIRQTVEWLQAGALGPVREVHAWTRAGRWNKESPKPIPAPVPAGVNWDLWIGTREMRPYSPNYTPVTWRDYWAFGTGVIGDMSPHHIDAALWALDLAAPQSVEASCAAGLDGDIAPPASIIRYHFGPRGNLPPLTLTWYDGGLMPPRPEELEDDDEMGQSGNGTIFVGDKGKMMCAGWGGPPRLLPLSRMDSYQRPPKTLARSKGHHRDWLDACKGGPAASSHFEYGAKLTELVLLGNIALRTGKKIQWDSAALRATNAPEADKFLKEPYRQGWEVV
ncbi:MAG: Gfo/Idh/MocA family oxidoreductase [Verrucomicrobia bacterium]|nr:Gfo/Idh/MocA family oxidoreductase [Verrucomicrobiota bacterium]